MRFAGPFPAEGGAEGPPKATLEALVGLVFGTVLFRAEMVAETLGLTCRFSILRKCVFRFAALFVANALRSHI